MELQQRSFNVYDDGDRRDGQEKTEDIYQCLQDPTTAPRGQVRTDQPTSGSASAAGGGKMMCLLLTIIIFLLTAILCIVVIHYYHFRQTQVVDEFNRGALSTNREVWILHDEKFYLFWSDYGDCDTAERFCTTRKASLAAVGEDNMVWLKSQINGKHFLVKTGQLDSSGFSDPTFMDGDESECQLLDVTSEFVKQEVEGWVCEKAV
ncbi:uncharacterized protein [Hoplias malabaricus]|uniref:uncharacterized protein n=1 Tax=Hoplias malabaricus TaxID=27720 RepID=UPI003461FF92